MSGLSFGGRHPARLANQVFEFECFHAYSNVAGLIDDGVLRQVDSQANAPRAKSFLQIAILTAELREPCCLDRLPSEAKHMFYAYHLMPSCHVFLREGFASRLFSGLVRIGNSSLNIKLNITLAYDFDLRFKVEFINKRLST